MDDFLDFDTSDILNDPIYLAQVAEDAAFNDPPF
jgi:hypothetical protein